MLNVCSPYICEYFVTAVVTLGYVILIEVGYVSTNLICSEARNCSMQVGFTSVCLDRGFLYSSILMTV